MKWNVNAPLEIVIIRSHQETVSAGISGEEEVGWNAEGWHIPKISLQSVNCLESTSLTKVTFESRQIPLWNSHPAHTETSSGPSLPMTRTCETRKNLPLALHYNRGLFIKIYDTPSMETEISNKINLIELANWVMHSHVPGGINQEVYMFLIFTACTIFVDNFRKHI